MSLRKELISKNYNIIYEDKDRIEFFKEQHYHLILQKGDDDITVLFPTRSELQIFYKEDLEFLLEVLKRKEELFGGNKDESNK